VTNDLVQSRPVRNSIPNLNSGPQLVVPLDPGQGQLAIDPPKPKRTRFDWSAANEDVVLRMQPATAIYVNTVNQIVIRQEGVFDDDTITILNIESVPAFIRRLQDVAQEAAAEGAS
jgi:hypothetical protein